MVAMTPTNALATSGYTDMPQDYSTAALEAAVKNGLLNGSDNKLMPNKNLTRAQMAAILVRAFGAEEKGDISAFSDVSPNAWYHDDMSKAVHMGLFKGDGTNLNPDAAITRQEAFTVLARAIKPQSPEGANLNKFSDKNSIATWAKDGVTAMIARGYVNGAGKVVVNGTFIIPKFEKVLTSKDGNLTITDSGTLKFSSGKKTYIAPSATNDPEASYTTTLGTNILFNNTTGMTIDGDVTLVKNEKIYSSSALNIADGATLTIATGATLTNQGALNVKGTLTVEGTLTNDGTLTNNGAIHVTLTGELIQGPVLPMMAVVLFQVKVLTLQSLPNSALLLK